MLLHQTCSRDVLSEITALLIRDTVSRISGRNRFYDSAVTSLKLPFAYIYENRLHLYCAGWNQEDFFVKIKNSELDFEAVMKRILALK